GTIAYVVNECHRDAQGLYSFSQKLLVRRGNCDPATVLELPPVGPVSNPLGDALGGTCHNFGAFRAGTGFTLIGRFQRLGEGAARGGGPSPIRSAMRSGERVTTSEPSGPVRGSPSSDGSSGSECCPTGRASESGTRKNPPSPPRLAPTRP